MLPVITAQNLFMLRDGTGKPFTQFMDSVLRASAARLGIRPGEVHTSLKTSVSDGGVDSQVDRGGDDPGARLLLPTMWQYKARRFGEISDAIIEDEILGPSKEYARELIRKRHAYRLCICDDAPSRDKLARQQELNRIVQQVFPTAAPALVLLASELAEWANHYPSTVAQLFGLPTEMFRYFESWRPSAIGDTPNFVASEHYRDFCAIVNAHLDWSQKPDEVALTVFGDAGIGKTRSVFEALNGEANQRELVIYTVDEEAAVGIATALTNESNREAILVADECLSQTRFRLSNILRGFEKRVRLITIDNAKERSRTISPELQILRASEQETLKVLDANFDSVAPERRRRYSAIAGGFLRFAIDMCTHDSSITESGNLSSALTDARSYYEYRFSDRFGFVREDRDALEIVAILDRVGYRGDRETELNSLCNILGRDPQNTKERIERIRTKTGFISSAGRFYYVTPAPVAMIAFESAWQTWASPDPYRFLKSIPEGLVQAFHNRVSSASPEVGAIVGKFFRQWTIGNGSRILESESDTRRLVALVAADPATQVPLLRMLVETANPAQIKGPVSPPFPFGGVTPRRLIVSVAEELAQFRSFFVDAEAILFRFATDETEPSLGNNATKTWMGLFRIVLSGTEVPFLQRYEILKKRLVANAPLEKKLVIAAAAAALDRNPYRIVGAPLFGSLVPPKEWHPPTYEDHMNAIRGCLLLLLEGTFDPNAEVSNTAKQALLDGASHLLWGGLVDPVRETLEGRLPDDLRPRLAALVRESYARAISQNAPAGNPETTKALENWLTSLKSDTLHERLIENVAVEPWSHHFEEEQWRNRIAELARDLFEDAQALTRELPWLGSNEAKAAADIRHYLGLCDQTELRFLDR